MDDSLFVFDISKRQASTYFNYNYVGSQYMFKTTEEVSDCTIVVEIIPIVLPSTRYNINVTSNFT